MTEKERHRTFSQWLRDHQGLLQKIARAYAYTLEDREDLLQDMAVQIWNSIPRFEGRSAVSTWLYRIAINTSMRWKSKSNQHSHTVEVQDHFLSVSSEVEDERIQWLYQQIQTLNKVDRSLAVLLLEGHSYKEMSTILGISESNIGVKIHRIKKQLIANSKKYEAHGI